MDFIKGVPKKAPADFIKGVLGRGAIIKLNDGSEYRGTLTCLDGFMNVAVEQVEEYDMEGNMTAAYGDCFFRGNNVLYISAITAKTITDQ